MKCASVIKIVIFLIINEICLAAGDIGNELAIVDAPSTKIQSCVAKIIEHILNPTESLAFVINSHPDYIPSRLPNPVTVMDMRATLPTHYKMYEMNYVIEAESHALLARTINTILWSPLWHPKESPKGKLVILIKEEEALQTIFFRLWRKLFILHIIVIIYDDTSKNCPMKVITSNPQAEGNNCAGYPTVFSNFSCDNISLEFLKPIRNYNGCPVYIQPSDGDIFEISWSNKADRVMYNLVAGLKRRLNVTPIFMFADSRERALKLVRDNEIIMGQHFFGSYQGWEDSIIFSRTQLAWTGPEPTRISPLKTVFLPFTYDLWIGVLFVTILMILIKWMIMKGNGNNDNCVNLACAFSDIIGLTFGVSVNRIPNIWSLKLLLAFFLIYVIHIHTAYTSDLINILTVPRYEGVIKNVEEVADSGLPVFMQDYLIHNYFKNVTDGGRLSGKLNKLINPMTADMLPSISKMRCFTVWDQDTLLTPNSRSWLNSESLREMNINSFVTNDVSGEIKQVFQLRNGSYFVESLNAVITHLLESGIDEADPHLNPNPSLPVWMKDPQFDTPTVALNRFSKDDGVRPLRLNDLLPVFVILLICYSFCIIIFVAEIFVHKIAALLHSTRNQVVPLNV